jgi:hypothetical protein
LLAGDRRVPQQRAADILPCGRDALADQSLQAIWEEVRLPTTAVQYESTAAQVHFELFISHE